MRVDYGAAGGQAAACEAAAFGSRLERSRRPASAAAAVCALLEPAPPRQRSLPLALCARRPASAAAAVCAVSPSGPARTRPARASVRPALGPLFALAAPHPCGGIRCSSS